MTEETAVKVTVRDLLRIHNFRWLWFGQIVSNIGDSLTHLTLVLLINRMTDGSTTAIAGLLIALTLPQATIGLVAGVYVDRMDRKQTMVISDLLRGVLVLGFIGATLLDGTIALWVIYVIAFLHSSVSAFFMPARSAVIPIIVPKEGLLAANSLGQITVVIFRVVGSAAAGVIVGVFDNFWIAFTVDAATFFVSMLFILQIRLEHKIKVSETATVRVIMSQLSEGLRLIGRSRLLVGTLMGLAITMLGLGAVNVLLAPMVVNDLNVNEAWFGAVNFSQSAAMVISGSLVAVLAARFKSTNIITVGLLGTGLAIMPIAFINQVWQLFIILFAVGLMVAPLSAAVATITQTAVSDSHRGRVSAAMNTTIQTASLVSMFAAGAVAAIVGVRNVFIISGIITFIAGLVSAWIFNETKLEKQTAVSTPAEQTI
jgi:DHA3 family macrolide efflux protein-like MFS transporter